MIIALLMLTLALVKYDLTQFKVITIFCIPIYSILLIIN